MRAPRPRPPHVVRWQAISAMGWPNLVLGNGFSIGIHRQLDYSSLFERASESGRLSAEAVRLFKDEEGRPVHNFEWVLRRLLVAIEVARDLGFNDDHTDALLRLQLEVREALTATIRDVHPERGEIGAEKLIQIAAVMRCYENVFTTNYDLIPYWAINEVASRVNPTFVDGFWSRANPMPFDEDTANGQFKRIAAPRLLYLHGGMHLITTSESETAKLRNQQELRWILESDDTSRVPLIVTEGTSHAKSLSIERVDYLRWARDHLRSSEGNVVVFGNRLDPVSDKHIADALSRSEDATSRHIAISVHEPSRLTPEELAERYANTLSVLPRYEGRIHFFDAATHPLASLPPLSYRRTFSSRDTDSAKMGEFLHDRYNFPSGDPVWVAGEGETAPTMTRLKWPSNVPVPDTGRVGDWTSRREVDLCGRWIPSG